MSISSDMSPISAFISKVLDYSDTHHLLRFDAKYIVALSGGADSVAMAVALHELGFQMECAHCNFHLRGDESDRDEIFCRTLCERMGVALHIAHFATREYAEGHKVSIEMAARHLRYDYFEKLRVDLGAEDVVVAHHRDDSVETVLLNLIRGTGIHGLTGISPRCGHVVRPMLGVGRKEIESFLNARHQPYITDSTNLADDALRNKIRHHVIPSMLEVSPSAAESIHQTAGRLGEVVSIFDTIMAEKVERASLTHGSSERKCYSIEHILDEHTLYYILYPLGFSPSQIEDIFSRKEHLATGALFASSTHELLIDRGKMFLQPVADYSIQYKMPIEGKYVIDNQRDVRISMVCNDGHFSIMREKTCACLDASKVTFPLLLRNVRQGDRFHPLGMRGSKLVSDFLTDQKINLFDKRQQWILTDSQGKILWVVGHRIDQRCKITETTKKVLVVELIQHHNT